MKKYLILYAVLVTAALIFALRHYRGENQRLTQNQEALAADLTHYRTRAGEEAAASASASAASKPRPDSLPPRKPASRPR